MSEDRLKRGRRCTRFRRVRLVEEFIVAVDLRKTMLGKMEIAISKVDHADLLFVT